MCDLSLIGSGSDCDSDDATENTRLMASAATVNRSFYSDDETVSHSEPAVIEPSTVSHRVSDSNGIVRNTNKFVIIQIIWIS